MMAGSPAGYLRVPTSYGYSGSGGGGGPPALSSERTIQVTVPTAAGTYDSIATLPAGCTIVNAYDDVTTAYDGAGASITVGTPTAPTAFMLAANSTPSSVNLYDKPQRTPQAAAEVIRVTRGGAAGTVGAATVIVFYATPEV
jgi:hypothetical protein